MLNVKVDRGDPTDLYEQVAGEIRRAIAEGEAKPGERLPPAKDLAAVLGVNTNTVLRSLRLLRDEGLLEFRRGRGISVAGSQNAAPSPSARRSSLLSHAGRVTSWMSWSRSFSGSADGRSEEFLVLGVCHDSPHEGRGAHRWMPLRSSPLHRPR